MKLLHMCVVLGTCVNQTKLYLQGDSVTLVKSVKLQALDSYIAYLQTGSV